MSAEKKNVVENENKKAEAVVITNAEAKELESVPAVQSDVVNEDVETEEEVVDSGVKIPIERNKFGSTPEGQPRYSYCVKGTYRGTPLQCNIKPVDDKGYLVLNIMNGINPDINLRVVNRIRRDFNGKKTRYTEYKAVVVDEAGEVIDYDVKPVSSSDKWMLDRIISEKTASKNA